MEGSGERVDYEKGIPTAPLEILEEYFKSPESRRTHGLENSA
jgi:hypothetical protein